MGLKELIFGKQIKQAHAAQYYNSTRTEYKTTVSNTQPSAKAAQTE